MNGNETSIIHFMHGVLRFAYTFFASERGTGFRRRHRRLGCQSRCSVTMSYENRSSANEHTVRSFISVVHDAVRRNVTADDDSDVDCSSVLSVTWSALRRSTRWQERAGYARGTLNRLS